MSTIINRILRKKSVRNIEALALANRLSFTTSQLDHFLLGKVMAAGTSEWTAYAALQQKLLMLDVDRPIPMEEEVEILIAYLTIVETLMPDGFLLKWDNRFQSHSAVMLPPLLLFPMIQHAVANGYNRTSSHPIRIRLSGSDKILLLEVSHRVNPYLDGQFDTTFLRDFQQRLQFLFPEQHSLLLNSNSNTCRATLTIRF